jgi:hypothetical protein
MNAIESGCRKVNGLSLKAENFMSQRGLRSLGTLNPTYPAFTEVKFGCPVASVEKVNEEVIPFVLPKSK